jgi:hypothetical protein
LAFLETQQTRSTGPSLEPPPARTCARYKFSPPHGFQHDRCLFPI